MGDPHLDDLEPGDGDPFGHLDRQLAGDDVRRAAQRRPCPGGVVVGVAHGHVAQGGFGLDEMKSTKLSTA